MRKFSNFDKRPKKSLAYQFLNNLATKFISIPQKKNEVFLKKTVLFPKIKFRVYTEDFAKNVPFLRLPLKLGIACLAHTSYILPFYFDHARLFAYRVQG